MEDLKRFVVGLAVYYLEEMKTRNLRPTQAVYESIIRKCFSVGDSRHQLALDEMVEQGYEVNGKLQKFLESSGSGEFQPTRKAFSPQKKGKGDNTLRKARHNTWRRTGDQTQEEQVQAPS